MFWDLFENLCSKKGVSPTKACKDMGLANGNIQRWKEGSAPRNSTALLISQYFDVPLYVIREEEIPMPTDADYIPPAPSESPYKAFLSTMALLTEEEIEQVTAYARTLLGKR